MTQIIYLIMMESFWVLIASDQNNLSLLLDLSTHILTNRKRKTMFTKRQFTIIDQPLLKSENLPS